MPTHKDYIQELLLNDELSKVLEELLKGTKASKQDDLYNSVIFQSGRNARNEKDFSMHIVSNDNYKMERARIRQAIQGLVSEYKAVLGYPEKLTERSGDMHGIEQEIEGIKKIIEGLIEKKVFLEESLLSAYDANQQFALKKQLVALGKEIEEKRNEIQTLAERTGSNESNTLNISGDGNLVFQDVNNSTINVQIRELERIAVAVEKDVVNLINPGATKKIVFMYSQTDGYSLDFGKEIKKIEMALKTSERNARDSFDFIVKQAVSADEFMRILNYYKPHIVHFSMHADKQRGLLFADDDGRSVAVKPEEIAEDFELLKEKNKNFECIIFSACNSELHAKETQKYIPYTIGMQGKIADLAAIEFAQGFYETIFDGETDYSFAYKMGQRKVKRNSNPGISQDSNIPVFYPQK